MDRRRRLSRPADPTASALYGADAERVLAEVGKASQEAMLVLELALATGARIGELVRTRRGGDHHLVPDRLLGERRLLLVGKGGLQRVVHVPETLCVRLETLATLNTEQEPLFTLVDRDVQRELRDACRRLGVTANGLRYDFAARLRARLVADGWTAEAADREVSLQLGHRRDHQPLPARRLISAVHRPYGLSGKPKWRTLESGRLKLDWESR